MTGRLGRYSDDETVKLRRLVSQAKLNGGGRVWVASQLNRPFNSVVAKMRDMGLTMDRYSGGRAASKASTTDSRTSATVNPAKDARFVRMLLTEGVRLGIVRVSAHG